MVAFGGAEGFKAALDRGDVWQTDNAVTPQGKEVEMFQWYKVSHKRVTGMGENLKLEQSKNLKGIKGYEAANKALEEMGWGLSLDPGEAKVHMAKGTVPESVLVELREAPPSVFFFVFQELREAVFCFQWFRRPSSRSSLTFTRSSQCRPEDLVGNIYC